MQSIIECFSAFIACLGFAFIFRIHQHPRFAIIGSIGGALGWLVYLLASNFKSEISCYFSAVSPWFLDVESIKQCYTVRKVTVNYF